MIECDLRYKEKRRHKRNLRRNDPGRPLTFLKDEKLFLKLDLEGAGHMKHSEKDPKQRAQKMQRRCLYNWLLDWRHHTP